MIQGTIKRSLPEGFQRAEFLLEKGYVDRIVKRKDLKEEIGKILDYLVPRPKDEPKEEPAAEDAADDKADKPKAKKPAPKKTSKATPKKASKAKAKKS